MACATMARRCCGCDSERISERPSRSSSSNRLIPEKGPSSAKQGSAPRKAGGQHHMAADHQAIEREMMPEKLPAPRVRGRGRAVEREDVAPFAQHRRPAHEVAEKAIEPHHVARDVVALRAQARAQHSHDRLAYLVGRLVEAQSVSLDMVLGVLP